MIEGVKIKKLKVIPDNRGFLMEILRRDWPEFKEFGQAYISMCYPGIVKAWHCHKHQTDYFCIINGNAKIGLYDDRDNSDTSGQTAEVIIGELNPALLIIPPLVWHGQMALGNKPSVLLNIPTNTYNYDVPDELRRDAFDKKINFKWYAENK